MREFLDDGGVEFRPATAADERWRDERTRREVMTRLAHAPWLDAHGVVVRVQGGEVRLEGTVCSARMALAIKDVAASCPGVLAVRDRLRIVAAPDPLL